jgi:hypothetical protein
MPKKMSANSFTFIYINSGIADKNARYACLCDSCSNRQATAKKLRRSRSTRPLQPRTLQNIYSTYLRQYASQKQFPVADCECDEGEECGPAAPDTATAIECCAPRLSEPDTDPDMGGLLLVSALTSLGVFVRTSVLNRFLPI